MVVLMVGGDANGLVDGTSSNEANLTNFTIRTADGSTFMGPEELTGSEVSSEDDQCNIHVRRQPCLAGR